MSASKKAHVTTTINGESTDFLCEPRHSLLEVLRDNLGLTGSKEGCNNGNCGACTVLLNGRPSIAVSSWVSKSKERKSRPLKESPAVRHPVQVFLKALALQCGICTPGFLVASKALLDKDPNASEETIRFDLSGNLCRCTGYDKIVRAVQAAGQQMSAEA